MLAILTVPPDATTEALYRLIAILARIAEAIAARYLGKPVSTFLIARPATRFCDELRESLLALAAEIEAQQQNAATDAAGTETPAAPIAPSARPRATKPTARARHTAAPRPAQTQTLRRGPITIPAQRPPIRTNAQSVPASKHAQFVPISKLNSPQPIPAAHLVFSRGDVPRPLSREIDRLAAAAAHGLKTPEARESAAEAARAVPLKR